MGWSSRSPLSPSEDFLTSELRVSRGDLTPSLPNTGNRRTSNLQRQGPTPNTRCSRQLPHNITSCPRWREVHAWTASETTVRLVGLEIAEWTWEIQKTLVPLACREHVQQSDTHPDQFMSLLGSSMCAVGRRLDIVIPVPCSPCISTPWLALISYKSKNLVPSLLDNWDMLASHSEVELYPLAFMSTVI